MTASPENHEKKDAQAAGGGIWPQPKPSDPVECDQCGAVFRRAELTALQVRTLKAVRWLSPERCEPAEHATSCPDCGSADSFQPAVRCAECRRRPCRCGAGKVVAVSQQRVARGHDRSFGGKERRSS